MGEEVPDFADLYGQENVRRAAEIAVAGGHNLLMVGPPGSGKTMTAKCMAGILPPMNYEESMELTKLYSVMGMLDGREPLISRRPFREVHHTATRAALIGGGIVPRPGEISLAHSGILFWMNFLNLREVFLKCSGSHWNNAAYRSQEPVGIISFRPILCLCLP